MGGAAGGGMIMGGASRFVDEMTAGLYECVDDGTGSFTTSSLKPEAEGLDDFWRGCKEHSVQTELGGIVFAGLEGDHAGSVVGDDEIDGESSAVLKGVMEIGGELVVAKHHQFELHVLYIPLSSRMCSLEL